MKLWRRSISSWIYNAAVCGPALLVNREEREEWLAEWKSELWYLLDGSRYDFRSPVSINWDITRFCMGAVNDAISLRRNSSRPRRWLQSATRCLALLAGLAVTTSLLALWEKRLHPPYTAPECVLGQLGVIGIALLILPAITTLSIGECPATRHSRALSVRRWLFLAIKIVLILAIVFCGSLDLGPIVASPGFRPYATLIGYILAFRWTLADQRRRCPVCLELLRNPVRIGQPSHIMLDWYGTELMCSRGHGLLHTAETPTSSYGAQQWLSLDPSWRSLFFYD